MKQTRKTNALKRLQAQLASGVKPEKINGKTTSNKVPLSPYDIVRIKKEITILLNL